MSKSIIHKEMMELGIKFADIARKSDSTKGARSAFDMAERAFKLALAAEPSARPSILDMNATFLSQLSEKTRRSELWLWYLDFCEEYAVLPLVKGEFFRKLSNYGFRVKKLSGEWYVCPPEQQPRVLQLAAERFKTGVTVDAGKI